MKHVKVPKDFPVIGGLMTAPDYSTGYQPITSKSETSLFSSIFPPEICAADLCEGELPGCPPPHIVPVDIPRVIFKMSRPFHWAPNTPMALREFIAYGFAVLPEVVDVVARRIHQGLGNTTTTTLPCIGSGCSGSARRLEDNEEATVRRLEEAEEGDQFDEVAVEFSDLTYTIDRPLLAKLIRNRAFDLLDDGNKRELGPIKIIGFDLESRVPTESWTEPSVMQNIPGKFTPSVAGMFSLLALLASVALMAIAFAKVHGRKNKHEEEDDPEDGTEMGSMQSRDVRSEEPRYQRVSMAA
eukprot:gnl/MRDRNA2_/MRDRNA2_112593_c0_seq1.p1 gnl/MRDRNA2_/MRDRNA2_112593_c0~~gnl/MRDRNA2_/MRDRNA2_112593_c0_seq1.p1  ORF type:complete len:347 (-),score=80.35 gnl/MRDRNA2_/MRDRNA2_112593_c0_seq1:319-1212(-)